MTWIFFILPSFHLQLSVHPVCTIKLITCTLAQSLGGIVYIYYTPDTYVLPLRCMIRMKKLWEEYGNVWEISYQNPSMSIERKWSGATQFIKWRWVRFEPRHGTRNCDKNTVKRTADAFQCVSLNLCFLSFSCHIFTNCEGCYNVWPRNTCFLFESLNFFLICCQSWYQNFQ